MKILTLNTWTEKGPWRKRWEIIFKAVGEMKPDFIAFQEVFNPEWANIIQERTGYEERVYLPESKISGLMILANYPAARAEILKYKTQSSSMEPKRYLLAAEFDFQNQKILFCNTHLTWRVGESEIRAGQAGEILNFIEKNNSPQMAVICGDFNASADTLEIKRVAGAGFMDTFSALNPGSEALTWDNDNPYAASASSRLPDRRIDFIFARGFGTPKASRIVLKKANENGIFASDHYGVLTEF